MTVERRYRAIVEYDGTNFFGYQIQAKERTVQGEIERALKKVTHSTIRADAAGRTDSGVHATGQVIAFNSAWKYDLAVLHRALNASLPDDIVISQLKMTNSRFHPRFSALSRSYRYFVINQPWPLVLQQRYGYHVRRELNVAAMQQGSQFLLGSHDFAAFGKPPQGNKTIRNMLQADWSANGNLLTFDITANAFLYRMVRKIVGTLLQVGFGQLAVNDIKKILDARDITGSAPSVPAHGLCLVKVTYAAEAV